MHLFELSPLHLLLLPLRSHILRSMLWYNILFAQFLRLHDHEVFLGGSKAVLLRKRYELDNSPTFLLLFSHYVSIFAEEPVSRYFRVATWVANALLYTQKVLN